MVIHRGLQQSGGVVGVVALLDPGSRIVQVGRDPQALVGVVVEELRLVLSIGVGVLDDARQAPREIVVELAHVFAAGSVGHRSVDPLEPTGDRVVAVGRVRVQDVAATANPGPAGHRDAPEGVIGGLVPQIGAVRVGTLYPGDVAHLVVGEPLGDPRADLDPLGSAQQVHVGRAGEPCRVRGGDPSGCTE